MVNVVRPIPSLFLSTATLARPMFCEHRGSLSLAIDARILLATHLGPSAVSVQAIIRDSFPHTLQLRKILEIPLLVRLRAPHRHRDLDIYPGFTLSDSSMNHADSKEMRAQGCPVRARLFVLAARPSICRSSSGGPAACFVSEPPRAVDFDVERLPIGYCPFMRDGLYH